MSSAPHFVDSLHSEGQFFEGLFRDYFPATFPFSHFVSRSTSSLSRFRLYGLDSPEGYDCVGDWPPDHKGGRCIQSHLCHFDLKKSLFSLWTWTKSPVSFWFEQSHLCHFVYKQRRSKFDLTDLQILSSHVLTSETSDMQVESQTSDKGTWDKMAVIGLHCTGSLFFAKLLRSFQRESVCKAKNAITMVPDWGLG